VQHQLFPYSTHSKRCTYVYPLCARSGLKKFACDHQSGASQSFIATSLPPERAVENASGMTEKYISILMSLSE